MGSAIRSEIRKIFTTRLWWGMALGMASVDFLLAMGFAALVGVGSSSSDGQGNPFSQVNAGTAQVIYNVGLLPTFGSITALFPLALGVLLITTEYRHKTISATFLATPRRGLVMSSKAVAVAVVGVVYALIHAVAAVAGGALILTTVKHQPTFLSDPEVLRSLGSGVLAFVVWTLLGFGFGMLVRNQIAAVMSAVAVTFIAQIALSIVFGIKGWGTAAKFLPGNLTGALVITSDPGGGGTSPFFGAAPSALILIGYAAVLAGIGAVIAARRDIT